MISQRLLVGKSYKHSIANLKEHLKTKNIIDIDITCIDIDGITVELTVADDVDKADFLKRYKKEVDLHEVYKKKYIEAYGELNKLNRKIRELESQLLRYRLAESKTKSKTGSKAEKKEFNIMDHLANLDYTERTKMRMYISKITNAQIGELMGLSSTYISTLVGQSCTVKKPWLTDIENHIADIEIEKYGHSLYEHKEIDVADKENEE